MLKINADDLGLNERTSDSIISCFESGRIHSASLMVNMNDSIRAVKIAKELKMDLGLHLNFTQLFTSKEVSDFLLINQKKTTHYLKGNKYNQVFYNPFLKNAFSHLYNSQMDEYKILTGEEARRIDGHHHMHLCMNVITEELIAKGSRVRRNFTFSTKEKNLFNVLYRYAIDQILERKYLLTEYFFSLVPIDLQRIEPIVQLSENHSVELMVHPENDEEYAFLMSDYWKETLRNRNI